MLRRYKPLLRAEFAAGDLIDEARFLTRAGYHIAAVSLCRTAVESRLRRAAMVSPRWDAIRKDTRATRISYFMAEYGFWPRDMQRRFDKLYAKLSAVLHNGLVEPVRAWELVEKSSRLMAELDRLVVHCLHTEGQPCTV